MKAWVGTSVFLASVWFPMAPAWTAPESAPPVAPVAKSGPAKPSCDVDSLKREAARSRGIGGAISSVVSTDRCATLMVILKMIIKGEIVAGRQAMPPTPLDVQAAQRELEVARATPEIRDAIADELAGVQDQTERLLLEAVVLHDEGKRLARDLLLRQIDASSRP